MAIDAPKILINRQIDKGLTAKERIVLWKACPLFFLGCLANSPVAFFALKKGLTTLYYRKESITKKVATNEGNNPLQQLNLFY